MFFFVLCVENRRQATRTKFQLDDIVKNRDFDLCLEFLQSMISLFCFIVSIFIGKTAEDNKKAYGARFIEDHETTRNDTFIDFFLAFFFNCILHFCLSSFEPTVFFRRSLDRCLPKCYCFIVVDYVLFVNYMIII